MPLFFCKQVTILPPAKVRVFSFFLALHHPNNRLENILYFFYVPLFNSIAKNVLGSKSIGGAFAAFPLAPPK
jgi:hypothetical protein